MKSFIVFALVVAAVVAAPAGPEATARIVSQDSDNIGTGEYRNGYETENGIKAQEQGALVDVGTENEGIEVVGSYSYPGPDGVLYTVTYTAGRNGFVPEGPHLPKNF